jgi:hypothetical protein
MSAGQHDVSSPIFHHPSSDGDAKVTRHAEKNVRLVGGECSPVLDRTNPCGELIGGVLVRHLHGTFQKRRLGQLGDSAAFGCGLAIDAF